MLSIVITLTLAVTATTAAIAPPATTVGIASQYAPGIFARVIATRQAGRTTYTLPRDLPMVAGYIAVVECARIGTLVQLRPVGRRRWETFLVADCAGSRETVRWMRRNEIICEVDGATARRWRTVGRGIRVEMRAARRTVEKIHERIRWGGKKDERIRATHRIDTIARRTLCR